MAWSRSVAAHAHTSIDSTKNNQIQDVSRLTCTKVFTASPHSPPPLPPSSLLSSCLTDGSIGTSMVYGQQSCTSDTNWTVISLAIYFVSRQRQTAARAQQKNLTSCCNVISLYRNLIQSPKVHRSGYPNENKIFKTASGQQMNGHFGLRPMDANGECICRCFAIRSTFRLEKCHLLFEASAAEWRRALPTHT